MASPVCPVCGVVVDPKRTTAMPFCSDRCRTIDLSRWLGENYTIPGPRSDEQDEEQPTD
jgi:hypothetical protein